MAIDGVILSGSTGQSRSAAGVKSFTTTTVTIVQDLYTDNGGYILAIGY